MPKFVYLPGTSDKRITPEVRGAALWRYLDLAKFLSTLSTSSLWFARADTVGDPYEGSITRAQLAARKKALKEMPGDWDLNRVEEFVSRLQRDRVRTTAINCWHMADHESMAMWKLYAPDGRGVAIRSSVDRLLKCFPEGDLRDFPDPARPLQLTADMTKKDDHGLPLALAVEFGTVAYADYIDPDADAQPDFWGDAVFLKRKSFEFEREFRAAAFGLAVDQDGRVTFDRMLFPNGGSPVPVDLDVLVERIYLSPAAPRWFVQVVTDSTARFGRSFPVVQSSLDVDPIY